MQQECSCGDSCPPCEKCSNPLCECYCDFEEGSEAEKEELDEEEAEQDIW